MEKSYKYKVEPIKEELEKIQHDAFIEMEKSNKEYKKAKKRKILIISSIIITTFLLFKLFIGHIDINFPNMINQHKNRLYQVSLNNKQITIGVEEVKRTTIIPLVLYLKNFSSHTFFGNDLFNYNLGEKVILDVKSFECFTKDNAKLSCTSSNSNLTKKEMNDVKYELYIKKSSRGEKVFYNGKLINDISNYLKEKGNYHISIIAKYKNVESTIYFDLNIE